MIFNYRGMSVELRRVEGVRPSGAYAYNAPPVPCYIFEFTREGHEGTIVYWLWNTPELVVTTKDEARALTDKAIKSVMFGGRKYATPREKKEYDLFMRVYGP